MVLFPGFQNLDVFGPIDVQFALSNQSPINLTMIAQTLDPVTSLAPRQAQVGSTYSTSVNPTHTFANPPVDLDVLFIPGGLGNRFLPPDHLADLLDYLRDVYPSLQYLITVCSGSSLAAQAGLLDGRNATSNKWAWYEVTKKGPKTNWIAKARWVQDGNIWSTSGVTAGIDGTLAWVASVFGEDFATRAANGLEHIRTTDPDNDPFAEINGAVDVPPVIKTW